MDLLCDTIRIVLKMDHSLNIEEGEYYVANYQLDHTGAEVDEAIGKALKLSDDGTAADSAKLGGKAPQYYIQPRNLLDNSDFRNPVNQRGQTSYTGNGYTIDRWQFQANDPKTVSIASNGVKVSTLDGTSTARLIQKQASLKEGVYTFAAMVNGSIKVRLVSFAVGAITTLNNANANYTGGYLEVDIRNGNPSFNLLVNADFEVVFEWAALYEGEYTAETLPPYVPKGYAAELAECKRFFERIHGGTNYTLFLSGYIQSESNAYFVLPFIEKAKVPTSIVANGNFRIRSVISYTVSSMTFGQLTVNNAEVTVISSGMNAKEACILQANLSPEAYIDIIADL